MTVMTELQTLASVFYHLCVCIILTLGPWHMYVLCMINSECRDDLSVIFEWKKMFYWLYRLTGILYYWFMPYTVIYMYVYIYMCVCVYIF